MTRLVRRAAVGALLIAALGLSACVAATPAKMAAGAGKGAVKGAVGAIF